jgi:hypothetical protein
VFVLHCTVNPADNAGACPLVNQVWVDMQVQASPFALSVQGATDISLAVIGVLALAWCFAKLGQVVSRTDGN